MQLIVSLGSTVVSGAKERQDAGCLFTRYEFGDRS